MLNISHGQSQWLTLGIVFGRVSQATCQMASEEQSSNIARSTTGRRLAAWLLSAVFRLPVVLGRLVVAPVLVQRYHITTAFQILSEGLPRGWVGELLVRIS
jgi:hypothetical protein